MPRPTTTTEPRIRAPRVRASAAATGRTEDAALEAKVLAVLELIRPSIQADGGDIELVEVTGDGDVTVRLLGACVGCPSSGLTLRNGIERQLRERVAQVRSVRADDHGPRRG